MNFLVVFYLSMPLYLPLILNEKERYNRCFPNLETGLLRFTQHDWQQVKQSNGSFENWLTLGKIGNGE